MYSILGTIHYTRRSWQGSPAQGMHTKPRTRAKLKCLVVFTRILQDVRGSGKCSESPTRSSICECFCVSSNKNSCGGPLCGVHPCLLKPGFERLSGWGEQQHGRAGQPGVVTAQ